jgi:hypothetical protein
MPVENVVRGESFTAHVYFYAQDGVTPFQPSKAVSFTVRSSDGSLITQGLGTQDLNNLAHWSASISLPTDAPTTVDGERYVLTWHAVSGSMTQTSTEYFSVSDQFDLDPDDSTTIAVENQPFTLYLRSQWSTLPTLSLRITDFHGNVKYTIAGLTDVVGTKDGRDYVYPVLIQPTYRQLVPTVQGVTPFLAYFNYTTPQHIQEVEVQQVIITSSIMITLMENVRRQCDRIRNRDFIPQLQVSQIDLANAVMMGYMMFNGYPPSNNGVFWPSHNNTPDQFLIFIQNCACIKLLQSLYLGEGMTAFNFAGQAVTLDMDRTQYIQAMISMLEEENSDARMAKNHYFRSGGGRWGRLGSVGGAWGPTSNVIYKISPLSLNSGFPILPFLR